MNYDPKKLGVPARAALLAGALISVGTGVAFAGAYGSQAVGPEIAWAPTNCNVPPAMNFNPTEVKDAKTDAAFRKKLQSHIDLVVAFKDCAEAQAKADSQAMNDAVRKYVTTDVNAKVNEVNETSKLLSARIEELNAKNAPPPKKEKKK